ncbi:hypothetical protein RCC89_10655 [Cytophagaceae bacterium ABcell3]|nr:hypothetical protein RCC89_10655 [Cytophagaceae bacterium ABcell3]
MQQEKNTAPSLSTFDLTKLVTQIRQEGKLENSGRNAKTLLKTDEIRVVLNTMKA